MAIKSILLHLTRDPRNQVRTQTAIALAATHEARLTALYTLVPPQIPAYVMGYIPPEATDRLARDARQEAQSEREVFEAACERAGVAAEWRLEAGQPHDLLAMQARYSDLVVIAQLAPGDERAPGTDGLPDELVLTAGRPILAVPYAGAFPRLGERVLVAWNGSREAARAVGDALPILQRAAAVVVFGVDRNTGDHIAGTDISAHLARHGVTVQASPAVAPDISIGDALLDAVSDLGSDLLVMGGYGHSRVRELALGGVTRHILRHMTVPVLMSH